MDIAPNNQVRSEHQTMNIAPNKASNRVQSDSQGPGRGNVLTCSDSGQLGERLAPPQRHIVSTGRALFDCFRIGAERGTQKGICAFPWGSVNT